MLIKKIFLFFLISLNVAKANTPSSASFIYEVAASKDSNFVRISLSVSNYVLDEEGFVTFEFDKKNIYSIIVYDVEGKKIKSVQIGDFVKFKLENPSFTIKYRVKMTKDNEKSDYLDNMLFSSGFVLFGHNTFIKPVNPANVNISPNIYVKTMIPSAWNVISSWVNSKKIYKVANFDNLTKGIFFAGDFKVKKENIKNKTYTFIFLGDWNKNMDRLISIYKTIANTQVNMFQFIPADFLIIAFIEGKNEGFQYLNSIVHFLSKDLNFQSVELLKFLAHEHFHIWNGSYIKPREIEKEKLNWFYEGATDYYALKSLLCSEIISEEIFLENLSKHYVSYESEDNTSSLMKIFAMDVEIFMASKMRKSFLDVLKEMSSKSTYWNLGYRNDDLRFEISKITNWDGDDFFYKYIVGNSKITFNQYFEYLGLELKVKKDFYINQGFEIKVIKNTNIVSNIISDSAAYKSGLRNRDVIENIITPKDKNKKMILTIKRNKKADKIEFNPWEERDKIVLKKVIDKISYKKLFLNCY